MVEKYVSPTENQLLCQCFNVYSGMKKCLKNPKIFQSHAANPLVVRE
jgi:hypothetical protein